MFTEIFYDDLGSGCPICGARLQVNLSKRARIQMPGLEESKLYTCNCKCGQLVFVKVETVAQEDDYQVRKTAFLLNEDWWDHCQYFYWSNSKSKLDDTLSPSPIILHEDAIWQLNKLRNRQATISRKQQRKKSKTSSKNS